MRITAMVVSFALLAAGSVAMLAAPAADAGVSGTFYETACFEQTPLGPPCPTDSSGSFFDSGPLPAALGQFSSSDSNGTYSFVENLSFPPVITGDPDFLFTWGGGIFRAPPNHIPCFNPGFVDECRWDITWSSSLAAGLSIIVDFKGAENANINIGNVGGMIGSDAGMPGCGFFAECVISGFWVSSVSEPSPLTGILPALLVVFFLMYRRRDPCCH